MPSRVQVPDLDGGGDQDGRGEGPEGDTWYPGPGILDEGRCKRLAVQ